MPNLRIPTWIYFYIWPLTPKKQKEIKVMNAHTFLFQNQNKIPQSKTLNTLKSNQSIWNLHLIEHCQSSSLFQLIKSMRFLWYLKWTKPKWNSLMNKKEKSNYIYAFVEKKWSEKNCLFNMFKLHTDSQLNLSHF